MLGLKFEVTSLGLHMVSINRTVIFTACSVNYLQKAVALFLSIFDNHDDIAAVILLVDSKRPVKIIDQRIKILWAEDINFPDYLQCAFKYNIIELNTALKPYAALKLLSEYSKLIYLDPDVCVFSNLNSIVDALDTHDTIFTPHAISPYIGNGRPSDQDLLRFGSFNLGFFAANDSANAKQLLMWWHTQCHAHCFYEPQIGYGVDQKWIDLAPSFFNGLYIVKDVGLNVAFWNLHERKISKAIIGWLVNGAVPLVFVHFSSFVELDREIIAAKQTRHAPGSRSDFSEIADAYRKYLVTAKINFMVSDTAYGYAEFDNGSAISPSLRRFYAVHKDERFINCINPFRSESEVYKFANENHLLSREKAVVAHAGFKEVGAYSQEQRLIAFAFRLMLRLLGPDKYFLLLKYIAHYSSILNQNDLLRR